MPSRKLGLLAALLLWALACQSQAIGKVDSLAVLQATKKLLAVFKYPNQQQFNALAADKISCILCAEQAEQTGNAVALPYLVDRNRFFREYLPALRQNAHVRRAYAMREIRLFYQSPKLLVALITTWRPNEYAGGHEGAQLELNFTKQNHALLFSGISTVP